MRHKKGIAALAAAGITIPQPIYQRIYWRLQKRSQRGMYSPAPGPFEIFFIHKLNS